LYVDQSSRTEASLFFLERLDSCARLVCRSKLSNESLLYASLFQSLIQARRCLTTRPKPAIKIKNQRGAATERKARVQRAVRLQYNIPVAWTHHHRDGDVPEDLLRHRKAAYCNFRSTYVLVGLWHNRVIKHSSSVCAPESVGRPGTRGSPFGPDL
jgi:hypothetical protein